MTAPGSFPVPCPWTKWPTQSASACFSIAVTEDPLLALCSPTCSIYTRTGERIEANGWRFEVVDLDGRRHRQNPRYPHAARPPNQSVADLPAPHLDRGHADRANWVAKASFFRPTTLLLRRLAPRLANTFENQRPPPPRHTCDCKCRAPASVRDRTVSSDASDFLERVQQGQVVADPRLITVARTGQLTFANVRNTMGLADTINVTPADEGQRPSGAERIRRATIAHVRNPHDAARPVAAA